EVIGVIEEQRRPTTNLQRDDVAILTSAAAEEPERIFRKFEDVADERRLFRTRSEHQRSLSLIPPINARCNPSSPQRAAEYRTASKSLRGSAASSAGRRRRRSIDMCARAR